jgi:3-oxocholest-4-en-26-oate---CoA ligase
MPIGVLWRQADVAVSTLGLRNRVELREWASLAECVAAVRPTPSRLLPCAPLMHGASQWAALGSLCEGNTVVFPARPEQFAASTVLEAVERHRVKTLTIVGDAFAYPLVEEVEKQRWDVSSLRFLVSGGAALHDNCRNRLQQLVPSLRIIENIGSSESGIQGSRHSDGDQRSAGAAFIPDPATVVIAEDFGSVLSPGHQGTGWLARRGRIPLGYLGDAVKTARTFPDVDGVRVTVPGDRARMLADGRVEMLGRDSLTVNTGGEKVFVEEVEAVLKDHPGVIDALVCGRPSKRWGSEVAGVVQTAPGIDETTLLNFCRDRLARYKVPKNLIFVASVRRNPAGKGDYNWAARQVAVATGRME